MLAGDHSIAGFFIFSKFNRRFFTQISTGICVIYVYLCISGLSPTKPCKVRKSLVSLGHPVHIFSLFHSCACLVVCVQNFSC